MVEETIPSIGMVSRSSIDRLIHTNGNVHMGSRFARDLIRIRCVENDTYRLAWLNDQSVLELRGVVIS